MVSLLFQHNVAPEFFPNRTVFVPTESLNHVDPRVVEKTEFRVYECRRCGRLWVVIAAQDPRDAEEHDHYIHRNILGIVHFAHHRMRSKEGEPGICSDVPVRRDDRPDVVAAYHLGGTVAVDDMGGVGGR